MIFYQNLYIYTPIFEYPYNLASEKLKIHIHVRHVAWMISRANWKWFANLVLRLSFSSWLNWAKGIWPIATSSTWKSSKICTKIWKWQPKLDRNQSSSHKNKCKASIYLQWILCNAKKELTILPNEKFSKLSFQG